MWSNDDFGSRAAAFIRGLIAERDRYVRLALAEWGLEPGEVCEIRAPEPVMRPGCEGAEPVLSAEIDLTVVLARVSDMGAAWRGWDATERVDRSRVEQTYRNGAGVAVVGLLAAAEAAKCPPPDAGRGLRLVVGDE